MEHRLVPHGDGFALPLDRDLLDLVEATESTAFIVEVRDGAVVATPVTPGPDEPTVDEAVQRRAAFEAALARVNERYATALATLGPGR